MALGADGDWAYVSYFRADNIALINAKVRPQVVFMGDSITSLWSLEPAFKSDGRRLSRGITGHTTQQMLIRFRSDVLNLRPAVVHIMGGLNDVAGAPGGRTENFEILGWFACMVDLARAHGIKVILGSIPPATDLFWAKVSSPGARISKLNASLRQYADQQKVIYADYWPALATDTGDIRPELAVDPAHPNSEGFARMEPTLIDAMERALA